MQTFQYKRCVKSAKGAENKGVPVLQKTFQAALLAISFFGILSNLANAKTEEVPLIPREAFFSHGERMRVRLSPDGQWIGFVAPIKDENGRPKGLGVYRAPVTDKDNVQPVLVDNNPRMPEYFFTLRSDKVFFLRDVGGNENQQLHVVDLKTGKVENLTNNNEVKAHYLGERLETPGLIYYSINDRDPQYQDVYSYNMDTGKSTLVFKNDQGFLGTDIDQKGRPRIGLKYDENGEMDYFYREADGDWKLLMKLSIEDATGTSPVASDFDNNVLYLTDTRGEDKSAFKSLDLKTGKLTTIVPPQKADLTNLITTFDGRTPLAIAYEHMRGEHVALQPGMAAELRKLKALADGDIQVMSNTVDDSKWLVAFFGDQKSVHYYLWDRKTMTGSLVFAMQPELDRLPLTPMHPLVITSRDGLELVSYLTLPRGVAFDPATLKPEKPLPMVLLVHGGPWARDSWGLNPEHQWLANRGYAVLSVNYRGSDGFGKNFTKASFGEWSGKMHDDLIDAVNFAVDHGIAIKDKIAIMGASYGGYAALVGATFTPDVFTASVDIVGVANLITSEESAPPYWKPFKANQTKRMGANIDTEEGRKFLWDRSPLSRVDQIRIPLLVGHGDNDPRVKLNEAVQIVDSMKEKGLPVTFIRFPDEGHGFTRPQNNQSFYAACEIFLQQNLGGRAEPLKLVPGTTINVPEGAQHIPGLAEAIKALK